MSEKINFTSSENPDNGKEKEKSIDPSGKMKSCELRNKKRTHPLTFKIKRRYNIPVTKSHSLKYREEGKFNTRQKIKQFPKNKICNLPEYVKAIDIANQYVSSAQCSNSLSCSDDTKPSLPDNLLHLSKAVTEISYPIAGNFNTTEVFINNTSILKNTQSYLRSSNNDSLMNTIRNTKKIAYNNSLSIYDLSNCSKASCNEIEISSSITSSSSDPFAKDSSNEIIHIMKSDNTLKGSFESRTCDGIDKIALHNLILHSRIDGDNLTDRKTIDETAIVFKSTESKSYENINNVILVNNTIRDSVENLENKKENYSPTYPEIEKIVVEMPTSSQEDNIMKYHAFLSKHMITTNDPLTLMLKSKEDKLVKINKSVDEVKSDSSGIEITLPNVDKSGKKTCVDEFRCFTSLTELWDKLAIYFDVSLKRMEISLTEKILSEIKRSYEKIEKYASEQTQSKLNSIKSKIEIDNKHNIKSNKTKRDYLNEFIQCNIQNQIDKLPFKMNNGDVKINLEDTFESKQLKKPMLKQYLEEMDPSGVSKKKPEAIYEDAAKDNEDKGNDNNLPGYRRAIEKSVRFVRTNAIVISGVPGFFIILFVVYGIILLIIKVVRV